MIKKYKQFLESISGTLTNVNGPGMPRQILRNTITSSDTDVVYSDITGKIYSKDEYDDLYKVHLQNGGKPLFGFNKENLDTVLTTKNR